jgi:hypothetical protein
MFYLLAEPAITMMMSCPACSATLDKTSELARGAFSASLFLIIPVVGLLSAIVLLVYKYHRAERPHDS